jgi:hypothetical protein
MITLLHLAQLTRWVLCIRSEQASNDFKYPYKVLATTILPPF